MNIQEYAEKSWNELLDRISKDGDVQYGPIMDLFDSENSLNEARLSLGKEKFKALQRYYLETLDPETLKLKVINHEAIFKRYLGPDKFSHLKLIVWIRSALNQKKRGLLASA